MILQAAQGQAKVPGLPVALNKASRITYVHMYVKYKYLIVTFVHFFNCPFKNFFDTRNVKHTPRFRM